MIHHNAQKDQQHRRRDLAGEYKFGDACQLAIISLSIVFGEKRENPEVIRKSVFGVIRHPIYLSEILFYLGLLMVSISLVAALMLSIAIVFLHYIAQYEERMCLARYGEEYSRHMKDVPMWIPGFMQNSRGETFKNSNL